MILLSMDKKIDLFEKSMGLLQHEVKGVKDKVLILATRTDK